MAETAPGPKLCPFQLILIPSLITLLVTILRLVGELQHWSEVFFKRSAGGMGAIVGIAWLPLFFGPYFAVKLARDGQGPKSAGKTIGFAVLGVVMCLAAVFWGSIPRLNFPAKIAVALVLIVGAVVVQFFAWPALAKALLAYAYAARIPVLIVMYLAMAGKWGTHYDAVPPGASVPASFWSRYFELAVVPQMVEWIVYTVILGMLVGSIVAAVTRRDKPASQSA